MTDQTAAEVLNDLIQLNNERISRYEKLTLLLTAGDYELRLLFAGIIGESHQNKIALATELQAMGEYIHLSPLKHGKVYEAAIAEMANFGEATRLDILNHTDAFENAVLLGYDYSLHSEDVAAYLRDLLFLHQTRIRSWHQQVKELREKMLNTG